MKKIWAMLTALALVCAMLPSAMAAEPSREEYTATSAWVTGSMTESDAITITYTIPEGTDYSKITFPIFDSAINGFPIYDENGEFLGNWTWVPGDSATITVNVVDETESYTYDTDSLWLGTKTFDASNPGEVVNRSYNPALYALIGIEQYSARDNGDVEEKLTDEALGALLVEAGYEGGIEDLDDYYCSYYGVDSLDALPEETLMKLFSGRWNGTFSGMYDATGGNETNAAVREIGWKNLYQNLFTVNSTGLLNYSVGSDALSDLDDTFATSVETESGVPLAIEIDGPKTTNCYQNHEIYMGLSFTMSLPATEEKPEKPSMDKTSNGEESIGSVRPGASVPFELTTNPPSELAKLAVWDETLEEYVPATDTEYPAELIFYDTLNRDAQGRALNNNLLFNNNVVVRIGSRTLTAGTDYTLAVPGANGETFTVSLDLIDLLNTGVITPEDLNTEVAIVITYSATVRSDATEGSTLINTAWVNDSGKDVVTGEVPGTESGGPGTVLFTLGGAALLAVAGALYVVNRRKIAG